MITKDSPSHTQARESPDVPDAAGPPSGGHGVARQDPQDGEVDLAIGAFQ